MEETPGFVPPQDRISLRLPPEERARWVAAAEVSGMSLSRWIRSMVQMSARSAADEAGDLQRWRAALAELRNWP